MSAQFPIIHFCSQANVHIILVFVCCHCSVPEALRYTSCSVSSLLMRLPRWKPLPKKISPTHDEASQIESVRDLRSRSEAPRQPQTAEAVFTATVSNTESELSGSTCTRSPDRAQRNGTLNTCDSAKTEPAEGAIQRKAPERRRMGPVGVCRRRLPVQMYFLVVC